jgi:hypothetical protein
VFENAFKESFKEESEEEKPRKSNMDILIPLVVISAILLVSIRKFKPQVWKKIVQLSLRNKMSWLKKVLHFFTPLSSVELPNPFKERVETVRARNTKGKYVADNPSTPDVNEAYKKVPKKKGRPRKNK